MGPSDLCSPSPPGDSKVLRWVSARTPSCWDHLGALKRNRKQELPQMDLTIISRGVAQPLLSNSLGNPEVQPVQEPLI